MSFSPGDVGLISRQEIIGMRFDRPHELLVLGIDDVRLSQVLEEELAGRSAAYEIVPALRDPVLFRMLPLLRQEVALGFPGGRLFADSVTNAVICHTLPRYGVAKPVLNKLHRGLPLTRLRRVLDYVDAFLHSDLGVPEIASVSGLSQFHFAKLFRQSVGRSIHQYVVDARVERARQLIAKGRLSLAAIGAHVGVPNPAQFSTMFRRRTGLTPSVYRGVIAHRGLLPDAGQPNPAMQPALKYWSTVAPTSKAPTSQATPL